jgi:chorismate mutase
MSNLDDIRLKLQSYEDKIINLIQERIQLGELVAQSKFPKIKDKMNSENLMELITNSEVEEKIINRVKNKCNNEDFGNILSSLYKNYIIPKTKEIQIEYLNNKLS